MQIVEALLRNQYVDFDTPSVTETFNVQKIGTILSNLAYYGYTLSKECYLSLQSLSDSQLDSFWQELSPALNEVTGANRNMAQFVVYKNFPTEVLAMSDAQYWLSQIAMYWGFPNELFTESEKERPPLSEKIKSMIVLQQSAPGTISQLLNQLIAQPTKWSDNQKQMFLTFVEHVKPTQIDITEYGFKENGIKAVVYTLEHAIPFYMRDITDILRLCATLSNCSMRGKIKFKKFKQAERKLIVNAIEQMLKTSSFYVEQDIAKKKETWKLLFNHIHIFDYACPLLQKVYVKLYKKQLHSFNAKVQKALDNRDVKLFTLLKDRPTEFIRLFRQIYSAFGHTCLSHLDYALLNADRVNLLKFKRYVNTINERKTLIYAPNGNWTKAQFVENTHSQLDESVIKHINVVIDDVLMSQNKIQYPNGVVIDPQLANVKLQTNDQELAEYGRGTCFPIPDNIKFVRTASYWKAKFEDGLDNCWFDNGWNFFDKDWKALGVCSWDWNSFGMSDCKSAIFSGDPTNSKDLEGRACQMIDLYLDKLREDGVRYAVWSILCYSHVSFSQADEVLATLQWGENPEQGRLYEPKRAQMVFPLKGNNLTKYIAYLDLVENKLVYLDANLYGKVSTAFDNLNMLSSRMPAMAEYLDTLPTIVDMFPNANVLGEQTEFNSGTETAFLYSDKGIAIKDTSAYVFKAVNQQNSFKKIENLL